MWLRLRLLFGNGHRTHDPVDVQDLRRTSVGVLRSVPGTRSDPSPPLLQVLDQRLHLLFPRIPCPHAVMLRSPGFPRSQRKSVEPWTWSEALRRMMMMMQRMGMSRWDAKEEEEGIHGCSNDEFFFLFFPSLSVRLFFSDLLFARDVMNLHTHTAVDKLGTSHGLIISI